ncbi:hypothetical protein C9374_004341 [Naegleria lovaniensis]|uniref:DUF4326 domain-containing protein n=1 Tax=Naegleria lovaniensis TaxID=51637 RepID=A0AA88GT65_NAELO|nr:uncharacterized protein C9374_004341 [Naegleria lovaniensis]KAG2383670.1 hypothetical protein C9374_004341 [Naegleria lovaniensis]
MISSHQEKAGFLLVTVEEESTSSSLSNSTKAFSNNGSTTNTKEPLHEYKHHHRRRNFRMMESTITNKTNKRQLAVEEGEEIPILHHHRANSSIIMDPSSMKFHDDDHLQHEATTISGRPHREELSLQATFLGKRNLTEFKAENHQDHHVVTEEIEDCQTPSPLVWNDEPMDHPGSFPHPVPDTYQAEHALEIPPNEPANHEREMEHQPLDQLQQPHQNFFCPQIVGYGNNGTLYVQSQHTGRLIPAVLSPKKKKPKTKHPLNAELINTKTNVVRIRKKKGQTVVNCDVYVGNKCFHGGWRLQESKWANPFEKLPKSESLQKYREYILSQPKLKRELIELKGKTLGCFCERHERPCHADVLCELVEELYP